MNLTTSYCSISSTANTNPPPRLESMHISMHSCLRIPTQYNRGPSGPLNAHNYYSFFSLCLRQFLHIPEKSALHSFLQFKKLHPCSSVFEIFSGQYILRRITPAANSVCTSKQLIRGYIKCAAHDQNLLPHQPLTLYLVTTTATSLIEHFIFPAF